ncbi:GNAT family N-acetyltransferase [Paraglaciecola aestuariivivens]
MEINTTTKTLNFVVEIARPSQTLAVLTLLPSLMSAQVLPTQFIIARCRDNPSHIFGVAACVPHIISTKWPGFALLLNVIPKFRRQGVGSALLEKIKVEAKSWNVDYLHVTEHIASNSPLAQFLLKQHFQTSSKMHYFLSQMPTTLPMLQRLVKALYRRNRIPNGYKLQPLVDADIAQVSALFAEQFHVPSAHAVHEMQQALNEPMSQEISLALCNGQQVVGFLLAKQSQNIPEVKYWVVGKNYQQGWAAALILEKFVSQANARGIKQGAYSCNHTTRATLNIAKKSGAELTDIRRSFMLKLGAHS